MLLSDGRPADTKQALTYFQEQFIRGPLAGTQLHGIGGYVFASACFVVHQLVLLAMCFNAILQPFDIHIVGFFVDVWDLFVHQKLP